MSTIKTDPQLEYELQELYISSRHWTSDINFVEDEIKILKDVLNKYLIHTENSQLKEAMNFYKILIQQDVIVLNLKSQISEFLKYMEPFVNGDEEEIGINLVEKFSTLEAGINSTSKYVKLLRSLLFSFAEDVMKADKDNNINKITQPEND